MSVHTAPHVITLVKGQHHYVFRFPAGQEQGLLSSLVDLADSPTSALDWCDAAVLAFQVGRLTAWPEPEWWTRTAERGSRNARVADPEEPV